MIDYVPFETSFAEAKNVKLDRNHVFKMKERLFKAGNSAVSVFKRKWNICAKRDFGKGRRHRIPKGFLK